jgi:hypothetical protein
MNAATYNRCQCGKPSTKGGRGLCWGCSTARFSGPKSKRKKVFVFNNRSELRAIRQVLSINDRASGLAIRRRIDVLSVFADGPTTRGTVAARLDCAASSAGFNVKHLVEAGLLAVHEHRPQLKSWRITEAGKDALSNPAVKAFQEVARG